MTILSYLWPLWYHDKHGLGKNLVLNIEPCALGGWGLSETRRAPGVVM